MTETTQALQQKPLTRQGAGEDFEWGLAEMMLGHSDDCLSFSSLSSTRNADDDGDDDLLMMRRRRSDLEDDELAESSAARRGHSLISSGWAARQAQNMIATIERRNHEPELTALASLHTVSMLDSSFLRGSESPTSRLQAASERPSTQASEILQMWRELEDEHLLSRVQARVRHQQNVERSVHLASTTISESQASENLDSSDGVSENGIEYRTWSHDQVGLGHEHEHEHENANGFDREQSFDLVEVERGRVRQIVHGWVESGLGDGSLNVNQRDGSPRSEWLDEIERERVRLVREWVQMTSQQRGSRSERREECQAGSGAEVHSLREGLAGGHDEVQPERTSHNTLRLLGRQALVDLLVRGERERQRELEGLMENHPVTDFAHRSRIQSLLRGRFLRSERPAEAERPRSTAASELIQLGQRYTVSGFREGFHNRLENIVRGQAGGNSDTTSSNNINGLRNEWPRTDNSYSFQLGDNNDLSQARGLDFVTSRLSNQTISTDSNMVIEGTYREENSNQEQIPQAQSTNDERESQQQPSHIHGGGASAEQMEVGWQETAFNDHQEPSRRVESEVGHPQDARRIWHEDVSNNAFGNRSQRSSGPQRDRRPSPFRRLNRFRPPDDDNVYGMELRELLSRRSVSNLLRSGFRESLDQLIQSYVERRGTSSIDWDFQRNLPSPASQGQVLEEQTDVANEDQNLNRPSVVLSTPPVPPSQPLWRHNLHQTSWSRHSLHRSELEWEMINDLRADMVRIQQGMSHMQRLLEACMDMQLELQRSVRQEVSAALNRSTGEKDSFVGTSEDGSKWSLVKKGTCCVCCDNQIDSLLYRCGHMCTCSKCANELVRGGGKCPLCRAPIAEVIRAYSIL